MLVYYVLFSSIFFLVWGIAWSKKDIFNLAVKIIFVAFSFWGLFWTLRLMGFVVKR